MQADLANSEIALLKARKALQDAQANPPAAGSDAPAPTPPASDVTALTAQVKALQATVDKQAAAISDLQKALSDKSLPDNLSTWLPQAGALAPTNINESPLDLYHDRQAYRDELRAAQASVQLDDGHDVGAHALYRLQFHITVPPGANKDKFAVVRLTVQPSTLSADEIARLYRLWLGHVAFRSNGLSGPSDASHSAVDPTYLAMSASSDLYRYIPIPVEHQAHGGDKGAASPPGSWKFVAIVPPELSGAALELLEKKDGLRGFATGLAASRLAAAADGSCPLSGDQLKKVVAIEYIAESIRAMGNWQLLYRDERQQLEDVVGQLGNVKIGLDAIASRLNANPNCAKQLSTSNFVPKSFTDFITDMGTTDGWTAAYAATPVDLSQQVSSNAAAMQSAQLALSLSGNMPLQGITGQGSLNYLQAAQGHVEALERIPLQVGFSDRTPCTNESAAVSCAQFGWIFGPHASLDPSSRTIRLQQTVHNYAGTVDLSVPSWWPKLSMKLQTSWVGNWHGGELIGAETTRDVTKALKPNRADLDGLTEALTAHSIGGALASAMISEVEPRTISLCGDSVSMLAFGSNIWRGTEAYLDGVRADDVRTAPDMAGLSLTFATSKLLAANPRPNRYLVVLTRNGPAEYPITVLPRSTCAADAGATGLLTTPIPHLTGESTKIDIVTSGLLPSQPISLEVTRAGATAKSIKVTPTEAGDGRTITLTFTTKLSSTDPTQNWPDGTPFTARVQLADPLNGKGAILAISRKLIYYKTTPTLTVSAQSKSLTDLASPIAVTFPPEAESGFNTFDPTKLGAKVGDGGQFPLVVAFLKKDGKAYLYRLSLADPSQEVAFRSADQKVTLTLDTTVGDVSDEIACADCLTVKLRPAAGAGK